MRLLPRLLLPIVVGLSPLAHAAMPLEQAARLYSQPDAIRMPQLSPDGSAFAYVTTVAGRDSLVVVHRATGRSDLVARAKTDLTHFAWKSDHEIVFLGNGLGRGVGFLTLADLTTNKQRPLVEFGRQAPDVRWYDALPGNPARMLVIRKRIGRVDLGTGVFTLTEPYTSENSHSGAYVPDASGTLRVRALYQPDEIQLQQRASDSDAFATFQTEKWTDPDIRPLGFGSDPGILYAVKFDTADAGRVVEMDARTGAERKELYRAPSGQIERGIFSPDQSRLEGILEFDTVRRAHWFNERLRAFQAAIDAALPRRVNDPLNFCGDETVALVRSATSRDPGDLYLFDARHGARVLIGRVNPGIDPAKQGEMAAVTIPARDGFALHAYLLRPGDAPAGPLPLIVETQRNLDYRWVQSYGGREQMLLSQGYAVLLVDYRGTWGYGYAYAHAGELQLADAIPNDLIDATRWAIQSGLADPKRIALMGSGNGATIALTAATRAPGLYRCLVNEEGIADLIWLYDNRDRYDWFAQKSLRALLKLDADYLTRASAQSRLSQLPDAVFNIYRDSFHNRSWDVLRAGLDHARKHYVLMTELPPSSFHPPADLDYNENVQLLKFLAQNL